MRILVVDDKESFLKMVGALFRERGDDVIEAANGVQALETARREPPDCIVSDILMPLMDGFTFCQECRRDERLKDVPFLFATGTFTGGRDREAAMQAGADGLLLKTQAPDAFLRQFEQILSRCEARREMPVESRPPEERGAMRQYNEALVRKVIEKVDQLQEANRRLLQMEETMCRLVDASSRLFGEAFFESMVLELAKTLEADITFIGRLRRERDKCRIGTLAVAVDGKPAPCFAYDLAGTPCENVVGRVTRAYAANAAELFPGSTLLRKMAIQGYVGTPLYDLSGAPVGVMAALFRSSLENTEFAESILQVFSLRVGSEIERKESEAELREHREHLEDLVRERTEELEAANTALRERAKELERFTEMAVGREKRMIGLKQEINDLLEEAGEPPRYRIVG